MRTSVTDPLLIASLPICSGHIGVTLCPGKHDNFAVSGKWARDLDLDLQTIQAWGATVVLTLVESWELTELKVPQLGDKVESYGMTWQHLPIKDFSIPDNEFEAKWLVVGKALRERLMKGERILIHCRGGLGRAGMMAARLLVELGTEPKAAIRTIRRKRPGAIETPAQLALVRHTQPMIDA